MKHENRKLTGTMAAMLAATAVIGFAAASCNEKKEVSQKNSEATVTTNENGSVSRSFTEMTVSTNGNLVTEHRRETHTTVDTQGNILATTTSEYAQSYPVGETGFAALSSPFASEKDAKSAIPAATDAFLGLKFGEPFACTNFVRESDEPTLLRAKFTPKKALAGFDDYYVYVTPKTHKVAKVCACAREAIDEGTLGPRHYLIEALEKRYGTWARPTHWCRPIYTLDIGSGRHVTACLEDASQAYETALVAWDDAALATAADEAEQIRAEEIKSANDRRKHRVQDAADAF